MPTSNAKPKNLSKVQQWVTPFSMPSPGTQEVNWGIKGLAIEPGRIEASRTDRASRYDDLSETSSTMFEQVGVRLEQHVGANNLLPAFWLEEGAGRSRCVCKIDASGVDLDGKTGSWSGTGFLVAPGIVCTNHHVINSPDVAWNSRAHFDFAAMAGGEIRPVSTYRLRPDRLFWTSSIPKPGDKGGLDVTFVAVDGEPGTTFGQLSLLRQNFAVGENDKLNIIQHPSGRLKEVALRENTLVNQDAKVIHYTSDTENGSSGAPVLNDAWELVALHHAAATVDGDKGKKVEANEGIKFSAIATALELDAQHGDASATQLLRLFRGTDELMGFFGSLGRKVRNLSDGMERVVDAYSGEDQDVDIGFWNIEWFNKHWHDKLDAVARIIIEMNLDIWVFEESSEEAAEALASHLAQQYHVKSWKVLASQEAPSSQQVTTVMWNSNTVTVTKKDWPDIVQRWFNVDSRSFGDLNLEAVHGKVFDRYPALYEVETQLKGNCSTFNLVPLHLKAMQEGSLRRQMAARLLAEAIAELAKDPASDNDWILGGDYNATLDSGDFDALVDAGLRPLTARDAAEGQFTYLKAPYTSLIDHIFVSRNIAPDDDDFFIVAEDRSIERFLDVSDHRPILIRLTASEHPSVKESASVILTEEETQRLTRGLGRGVGRAMSPADVEDALRRLGDQAIYYDGAADRIVRDHYWRGVVPGGLDFATKLATHLEQTHARHLSYAPATHVYPWVDLRPNGKVQSIYSGFEASPEFFIQADAEVERRRTEAHTALLERNLGLESTALEAMLEAQFPYNCEHVVPQSWFQKREPMRGDIHHLFACEPRCNSFRGNNPLVQLKLERTMQDCGRLDDDGFEPKGGKGAVARATLYFLLRYPGIIRNHYRGQSLETLLYWHRQFGPDEWEHHRNAAICVLQGNRNPFVDFPEWADQIEFTA